MQGTPLGQAFRRQPPGVPAGVVNTADAKFRRQRIEPVRPPGRVAGGAGARVAAAELRPGEKAQLQQAIVQFVGPARADPGLAPDLVRRRHGNDAQGGGIAEVIGFRANRPGSPVLGFAVVEEGIGPRVDDFPG